MVFEWEKKKKGKWNNELSKGERKRLNRREKMKNYIILINKQCSISVIEHIYLNQESVDLELTALSSLVIIRFSPVLS